MALEIKYLNEEAPQPKVLVSVRLWETADGERLVGDGHEDAATLFCAPGHEVSQADLERFELDKSLGKVIEVREEAEGGDEPAAARARTKKKKAGKEPESGDQADQGGGEGGE